ncbi:MAG: ABC-2 transporter permease [Lachnospiraceae bacterium]|nr:ABC-2 transporter permease [Lachnospiraceae bacterium]
MKGLLIKDYLTIAKQKKLAVLYVFVAIMLSFSMDSSFIVSYFSLIGSLLVLTTLTYDSFDNGYPFLMSLPVTAKTYVYAKYLFSFLGLLGFWGFSVILQFASLILRK